MFRAMEENVKAIPLKLDLLQFELVAAICEYDPECTYKKLLKSNLDNTSLGFWVWDIENDKEYYSPKIREVLGYKDRRDFPDIPESWQKAIAPEDLVKAINNFNEHVKTKAEQGYTQEVTYNTKQGKKIKLICHGKVLSWDGDKPLVMIGVHLPIPKQIN